MEKFNIRKFTSQMLGNHQLSNMALAITALIESGFQVRGEQSANMQ